MKAPEPVSYTYQPVSLGTLLTVLFVGLKLGGVIDWSWLWVFAPIWIPLVTVLLCLALGAIIIATTSDKG